MENKQIFEKLKEQGYVYYEECPAGINLNDKDAYVELELTDRDEMKLAKLVESIPAFAEMMEKGLGGIISLPDGISKMSAVLAEGIISSALLGQMAALGGANVLGAFSMLTIFTGQFFLLSITKEFEKINQKLDEILTFLRNEKESSLLSEVNFIKYACDNYSFIMPNEPQRIATIANIQQAKKVAMKDIEFYLRNFDNIVEKSKQIGNVSDLQKEINNLTEIEERLDFALQLYIMSSLMEVCYAQNYERKYIGNIKTYVEEYVHACTKKMWEGYSTMKGYLGEPKNNRKDKETYKECLKVVGIKIGSVDKKYQDMCDRAYEVLEKSTQEAEYYIKKERDKYRIYYKK